MPLPSDYRTFVSTYGTGNLADFVHVFNPFAESKFLCLAECVKRISDGNRYLKEQSFRNDMVPFPIYPERPGLVPWGRNDVGQNMYWLTDGHPDEWPVVLGSSRGPEHERFEMNMTSFLARALTRTLGSEIWPSDFPAPDAQLVFYAAKPRRGRKKK